MSQRVEPNWRISSVLIVSTEVYAQLKLKLVGMDLLSRNGNGGPRTNARAPLLPSPIAPSCPENPSENLHPGSLNTLGSQIKGICTLTPLTHISPKLPSCPSTQEELLEM